MFSVEHIIQSGGLLAIALIVFAESGLLIGFFLPGDSLLLTAGFLAGVGVIPIGAVVPVVVISAIIGYEVGYVIGQKAGPRVFKRKDGVLFRRDYAERAQTFFDRYGPLTVIMARFVPIIRTVVSTIAGVGNMDRRRFTLYNICGAVLWGSSLTLLGYWLGNLVPDFDKYLVYGLIIATVATVGVAFWHVAKDRETRKQLFKELRAELRHLTTWHKTKKSN